MVGITIGALANAAGVWIDTIRRYETHGFIYPPALYLLRYDFDFERVRIILEAQGLCFMLSENAALLSLRASGTVRAADDSEITGRKIADAIARVSEFSRVSAALKQLAKQNPVEAPVTDCPIVAHLANTRTAPGEVWPWAPAPRQDLRQQNGRALHERMPGQTSQ